MIKCKLPLLLAEKRLKVADAVRETGISKTTLHKIYNEQSTRIEFETIDKLCAFLEVSVDELFEHIPNKVKNDANEREVKDDK
ncbi:XRE family transcriptional regulator [Moraxella osloensis]|jgi:putative transcriptional regulator|uniref:XRE family transcriptional regulator n=1 Tax=Faucicola osloensis TaxID=34062 RepID=A0AAD2JBI8_FAUOS|nr:helix-turn-helix transcriptional regulator [Moraxella osloensis]ATW70741.1 XRE family transcriptional regulator [Moraxella osloensis]ATY49442.1 XRE family transcriptional regulator [Moraxella osloensis]NOX79046.1 helix-turn-helix transcriptional regulator [Gammaproteobacteria bacterium]